MKIKILKSDELKSDDWYKNYVGTEFEVSRYDLTSSADLRFSVFNHGWIYSYDCVITELPESFCVKRCDDKEKWRKYINWLNKTYLACFNGTYWSYYGVECYRVDNKDEPFGMEIHIDDMIKHIEYMESQQHIKGGEQFLKESQLTVKMNKEFDLTTDEGRLAYAEKHYPIGTTYKPLDCDGNVYTSRSEVNAAFKPRIWVSDDSVNRGIEVSGFGLIYHEKTNRWAEIIKEEKNMGTQKLSRQGLKEIHSVACSSWKETLEQFGRRNPLEDYIELTQEEINIMFDACTKEQLPIVSKYITKDDSSVDLSKYDITAPTSIIIEVRNRMEYANKSFWLDSKFDWEIKKDSKGQLCLIPTKKK